MEIKIDDRYLDTELVLSEDLDASDTLEYLYDALWKLQKSEFTLIDTEFAAVINVDEATKSVNIAISDNIDVEYLKELIRSSIYVESMMVADYSNHLLGQLLQLADPDVCDECKDEIINGYR